jgi:recombination protein RecT
MLNSDSVKNRFMEIMGEKAPAFITSILSAVHKNALLARCEPQSIIASALVAATLDLPVDSNLGFAAIIPYGGVAQFQIMYKGFIQLALRSGQYKNINVGPIYEDEFESYDIITGDVHIRQVEDGFRDNDMQDKIIGYAAFFRLLNGYERIEYWSLKKLAAHGERYSKSFKKDSSLWKTDPHVMYAKTVLKNTLSKWGILSVSMQTAMITDQAAIKNFDRPLDGDNVDYVDNREDGETARAEDGAGAADGGSAETFSLPAALEAPDETGKPPPRQAPKEERKESAAAPAAPPAEKQAEGADKTHGGKIGLF